MRKRFTHQHSGWIEIAYNENSLANIMVFKLFISLIYQCAERFYATLIFCSDHICMLSIFDITTLVGTYCLVNLDFVEFIMCLQSSKR